MEIGDGNPVPEDVSTPLRRGGSAVTRNLGTAVYTELSDRLVKGRFQPDDRLRIRALAESLGTSVTPVRDAVLRLVQDRALVMRSQRDIRVPILSETEFAEILTIRTTLEALAAETAATHVGEGTADPGLATALRDLNAREVEALEHDDDATATEMNQLFHFHLADGARMPLLRRLLERLWLQMGPLLALAARDVGHGPVGYHDACVDALERGDGAAAAEAICKDIECGGIAVFRRIRAFHADAAVARGDGRFLPDRASG